MGTTETLADIVGSYVDVQIGIILENETRLLAGDLTAVHPTRVAIRRLRATLRTFRRVYRRRARNDLAEDLKWWGLVLGDLRDLEVLDARVSDALCALPDRESAHAAQDALRACVDADCRAAWLRAGVALGSPRYAGLHATLHEWQRHPPLGRDANRPADDVRTAVDAADRVLTRRIERALAAAESPAAAAQLHAARKAGKQHRYALELALPVLGDEAEALVERRRAMQDALGEQQDAAVARDFVLRLAAMADAAAQPALDSLVQRESAIVAAAVAALTPYAPAP